LTGPVFNEQTGIFETLSDGYMRKRLSEIQVTGITPRSRCFVYEKGRALYAYKIQSVASGGGGCLFFSKQQGLLTTNVNKGT
jgi:hypothetical protein